jgi:hypothetical protein
MPAQLPPRPATQAPTHSGCLAASSRTSPVTSTGMVSTSHAPVAATPPAMITLADPGPIQNRYRLITHKPSR